eukprot:10959415-Karenia_brevis.AAC.1
MDPWGMGKGGYTMQRAFGGQRNYYKGHQKGWTPQGPKWHYNHHHNNYQQWSHPPTHQQRPQQQNFKPLNSG